ncbi:MAG TPA: hypothetical protein VGP72_07840 [Planctomycetota bacterium]|jgi:sugar lactone lactonase YvrE
MARKLFLARYLAWALLLIAPAGWAATISGTFAGSGVAGFSGDGGPALKASFNVPTALAVDGLGNVYIADLNNHRVRKVDASAGNVSTIAGTGVATYDGDGKPATQAALSSPRGLVLDGAGNLYIADSGNHRVRRIDAQSGNITTVAGNGSTNGAGDGGAATAAGLPRCLYVALDAGGNLYIVDAHRIRKVDAKSGDISTVAGTGVSGFSGDGGLATAAQLADPVAVAIDSNGDLFIADRTNNRVRKVETATGIITTYAGGGTGVGDGGPATSGNFVGPNGLAFSPAGNLYISDVNRNRVRRITPSTGVISTWMGAGMDTDGSLASRSMVLGPIGITANSTHIYICEGGSHRIRTTTTATPTNTEDTDQDGFPDAVETAANTNPTDANSNPTPGFMTIRRITNPVLSVHFGPAGKSKDKITLSGSVVTPTAPLTAQRVIVDVGGVVGGIDISEKGKNVTHGNDTISFTMDKKNSTSSSTTYKFKATLSNGDFSAALADEGLTQDTTVKTMRAVTCSLIFYNRILAADANLLFAKTSGKSSTSKSTFSTDTSDVLPSRADTGGD